MGAASKQKKGKSQRADEIVIPDKLYFRIGEVARLCGLPTYVLRFWETEFPSLAPRKSNTGQRMYRQRDVENVVRIKKLLYEEGFTISGAVQQLKLESKPALPFAAPKADSHKLKQIKAGLKELHAMVSRKR